jgi:hypothetical protein
MIYEWIARIVGGPGVDQLVVYFAGHGVNINRGEQWLLTDAPVRTSAAVNVSGSVELGRYSGIPHVVVISDACRVAPEGIQAQNVRGVDVFPNEGAGDRARPVDQFFAYFLGKTAAELKDPAVAASNYTALYTSSLLDALHGKSPQVLEPAGTAEDTAHYVRVRKLQTYLESDIPRRVKAMNLQTKVNQNPDAIITSDGAWLARIERVPSTRRRRGALPSAPAPDVGAPVNLLGVSRELVRSVAADTPATLDEQLEQVRTAQVTGAVQLAGAVAHIATPFGPEHFDSECGIKIRGARVVEVFATRARGTIAGTDVLLDRVEFPGTSVLLGFEGDIGTVIPAISGFVAALTFDDGELVDVAYEPSANTWRWDLYKSKSAEVRALRAVAASASRHGRFRLEQPDAINVARKMQYAKGIDPTLAVYAAYAYHDLQALDRIREMSSYLQGDLNVGFFDLALLVRNLVDKSVKRADPIAPFFPLFSQGWTLLRAHRTRLHPALDGIERTMRDSLWSLFDATGLEQRRQAMQTGEVR